MTLIRYILFSVCLLCGVAAQAQVKIHGKVTDADNSPMEFVTVRVAGTAIGTTTGLEGEYQLSAAQQDTIKLVFTCIGYRRSSVS